MSSAPFLEADLRTLALARPLASAELIDRYLSYQRAFLAALAEPEVSFGDAHAQALTDSGLSPKDHPAVAAVCRAFAGRGATIRRVRERLREAEAQGAEDRAERLRPELDRLLADSSLARRWGDAVQGWLEEREEALVTLHERLQRVELLPSPADG